MLLREESYEDGSKILAESLGTVSSNSNIASINSVNDNAYNTVNKDVNTNINSNLNSNNRGENMVNAQVKESNESVRNFNFKPVKKIEANASVKTSKVARKKVVQFNKAFNENTSYASVSHIANDELHRGHLNLVDSEEDMPSKNQNVSQESVANKNTVNVAPTNKVSTVNKTVNINTQEKKEILNNSIDVAKTSGVFIKNVSVGTAKIYTSFLMTMLSSILFMVQNISPILQGTFNLALPAFATWLISTKIPHVATMMHTFAPEAKALCYASFYFGSFFAWVTACLVLTNLLSGIGLGMKKLAQVGAQTK
jgi:hypothetical protein